MGKRNCRLKASQWQAFCAVQQRVEPDEGRMVARRLTRLRGARRIEAPFAG
jgi:hypothetical protein